jgi:glutamate N-acetyltransferase/amino-acid N-acetyltransferase
MPVNLVATPSFSPPPVPVCAGASPKYPQGRQGFAVLLLDEGQTVGAVFTQNRFVRHPLVQICRDLAKKMLG